MPSEEKYLVPSEEGWNSKPSGAIRCGGGGEDGEGKAKRFPWGDEDRVDDGTAGGERWATIRRGGAVGEETRIRLGYA